MEKKFYFQKTHEVDKEEFARLLKLAKGGRTLKDFAQICGVVPSTFTRITQGLNKGASSTELLEAIARNAVPSSGVTLPMLAAANGYTVREQTKPVKFEDAYSRREASLIQSILCQELIERHKQVRLENGTCKIGRSTSYKPNLLISTDAFVGKNNSELTSWFVEYVLDVFEITLENPDYEKDSYNHTVKYHALDILAKWALLSIVAHKKYSSLRFSMVVTDRMAFDILVRDFGCLLLDFDVTLVLVDLNQCHVADEYMIPLKNVKDRLSFFTTGRTISDEPNNDDYSDMWAHLEGEDLEI